MFDIIHKGALTVERLFLLEFVAQKSRYAFPKYQ